MTFDRNVDRLLQQLDLGRRFHFPHLSDDLRHIRDLILWITLPKHFYEAALAADLRARSGSNHGVDLQQRSAFGRLKQLG